MKKMSQILITVAMIFGPLFTGTIASAEDCSITNTGPGSTNECEQIEEFTCKVINDNKVVIENDNTQVSVSGDAAVIGNTTGGSALTGSATNSNGVTYNVTVRNGVCEVAVVNPPVTPPAGGAGGGGAGAGQGGGVAQVVAPASLGLGGAGALLPETNSDVAGYVIALAGALGLGLIVFYLITLAFRRFNS